MKHPKQGVQRVRVVAITAIAAIVCSAVVFSTGLAPYPYMKMDTSALLQSPSRQHLLGTDALGRDLLSRIIVGTRITVISSLLSVLIGAVPGAIAGIAIGMRRGSKSSNASRLMSLWIAVPGLLVVVVLSAAFGRSAVVLAVALGVAGIPAYYRQARAETLKQRSAEYVAAARSVGASTARVWFVHILRNILATYVVYVTFRVGVMMLAIGGLSFIGFGAQPPIPEWGALLAEGREYMYEAWWLSVFPGVAIAITVFWFNLLGDYLRDRVDRTTSHRR